MTDSLSSTGVAGLWREIDSATPRDRFIILWCREDDSYWWAKWQGGMWHGVDDCGLTRDSDNFTPDYWCEPPVYSDAAQRQPERQVAIDSDGNPVYFVRQSLSDEDMQSLESLARGMGFGRTFHALSRALEIVKGEAPQPASNAYTAKEPVAYVPLSKSERDRGEPIWREVFAAKWRDKDVWHGFDLMPLYANPQEPIVVICYGSGCPTPGICAKDGCGASSLSSTPSKTAEG